LKSTETEVRRNRLTRQAIFSNFGSLKSTETRELHKRSRQRPVSAISAR